MAAVDYFLKVDGVEGESADGKHKGEIDLESWSWGAQQSGGSAYGGGGAGKVAMQDFHFTMKFNKATPKLILACASGQHIKEAALTCRKAGGKQEDSRTARDADRGNLAAARCRRCGVAGSSERLRVRIT